MKTLACLLFALGFVLQAAPSRTTLQPADLAGRSFFGFSASVSGNLMAVGAPLLNGNNSFGQGAVYIYQKTSGNGWIQQARIVSPVFEFNDDFGISVALEGNLLLVGAPRSESTQGRVYEFRLISGAWIYQQTIIPAVNDMLFGNTLSLNRGTLAVGSGALNTASVYVFNRDQATSSWSVPVRLRSNGTFSALGFGQALALQGDALVIGAPHQGGAFVYVRRNGVWNQDVVVDAPTNSGLFGWSVAIDKGRVAIGAPLGLLGGEVYVYNFVNNSQWSPAFSIGASAAGEATYANFGLSVALFDTTLAVGAPAQAVGTVSVFTLGAANTWTKTGRFVADAGGNEALFGRAIVLPDNNSTIIASPGWSSATAQFLGAVDVFQK